MRAGDTILTSSCWYTCISFGCLLQHCVKSVQIRSSFWSVFFCIRPEYRKIRNKKTFVFEHFSRNANSSLFTLFTQCCLGHKKKTPISVCILYQYYVKYLISGIILMVCESFSNVNGTRMLKFVNIDRFRRAGDCSFLC